MKSLQQIWEALAAQGYSSDKGSVHSYIPEYEKLFEIMRTAAGRVLEIGVFKGDSLRMWREFFPYAELHGVDCSATPHDGMADLRPMIEDGWPIHILDAESELAFQDKFGGIKFDVVIEDAGHDLRQQIKIFQNVSPYVNKGGLYVIEDVQDIDSARMIFEHMGGEVVDLRHVKGRYDDVLIIFRL